MKTTNQIAKELIDDNIRLAHELRCLLMFCHGHIKPSEFTLNHIKDAIRVNEVLRYRLLKAKKAVKRSILLDKQSTLRLADSPVCAGGDHG